MASEVERVPSVLPVEYEFDERSPWDRLDGETPSENVWFQAYCKLGRKRSYKAVSEALDVPRDRIQRTAQKHAWVQRADSRDAELDRRRLAEIMETQVQVQHDHAALLRQAREKLQEKITTMDSMKIQERDVPSWLETVTKAERQNVGLSDAAKKVEITGANGGPIQVSEMSSAERRQILADIVEAASKRQAAITAAEDDEIVDADVIEDDDGREPGLA